MGSVRSFGGSSVSEAVGQEAGRRQDDKNQMKYNEKHQLVKC